MQTMTHLDGVIKVLYGTSPVPSFREIFFFLHQRVFPFLPPEISLFTSFPPSSHFYPWWSFPPASTFNLLQNIYPYWFNEEYIQYERLQRESFLVWLTIADEMPLDVRTFGNNFRMHNLLTQLLEAWAQILKRVKIHHFSNVEFISLILMSL